ncbi:hypothetical protein LOTGIDRAFT_169947 [Lottia gigantea]|uniref:Uncharacterized protein n=1 Tax=Lottia gigantea TaxID=225164 RepID=V3YWR0_LOTGI|nr:hypothetical protein LOTGIDRAFT_169947 [Lottia gigantea]ESO82473.1 hypothetical protein LOTGIDRAFT_169947 [Lottia gigantea]
MLEVPQVVLMLILPFWTYDQNNFSLSTSDGGNILECFRKLEVIPDTDSTESFMPWMKEYLESTGHHGTDDVEVPLEARGTRPKRTNPVKLELPSQIQQPKLLTTKHDPSATPTTSLPTTGLHQGFC